MSGSVDRTVVVPIPDEDIGQVLAWPNKNPADALLYYVDFTAWLADAFPGQTVTFDLASAQVVLGDSAIGINGLVVITGPVISFEIVAGTPGVVYAFKVTAQTATAPPQVKTVFVTLAVNGGQAISTYGSSSSLSISGAELAMLLDGQDLSLADVTPTGSDTPETLATLAATANAAAPQAALTAEVNRAEAAESALSTSVSNVSGMLATISGAISTETTRAEAAEVLLTKQIGTDVNLLSVTGYDPLGINDCTALLQSTLNALAAEGGGTAKGNATDFMLINGAVTMPPNTAIDFQVRKAGVPGNGVFGLNTANSFGLGKGAGGTILLGPSGSITLSGNNALQDCYIVPQGLVVPINATQAQSVINSFAGTAVTVNGQDNLIRNVCCVGFNLFVDAAYKGGRLIIEDCPDDCTNSYVVSGSVDIDRLDGCVHQALYVNQNITTQFAPHPLSLAIRQGTFIAGGSLTSTTSDVLQIKDCFSWGQQYGGVFTNLYLANWEGGGCECGYGGWGPGGLNLSTTVGLQITGTTGMVISNAEFSNHQSNIINAATGKVAINGCAFGASGGVVWHIWAQPGSDTTVTAPRFNAGPTPCIYVQAGVLGFQCTGWTATTVFNCLQVDDAALPFLTFKGNPPSGEAANSPYNGMERGVPWQYNISVDLTTAQVFPAVNSSGTAVYPNVYVGLSNNAINSLFASHQVGAGIVHQGINADAAVTSAHMTYATAASINTQEVTIANATPNGYAVWTNFPPGTISTAGGTPVTLKNERDVSNHSVNTFNMCVPTGHTITNLAAGAIGLSLAPGAFAKFVQYGSTAWFIKYSSGTVAAVFS